MFGRKLGVAFMAAVLAALFLVPARAEAGTPRNMLVVGLNMLTMLTLDPQNSTDPGTHLYATNAYDYLIFADAPDTNNLLPGLAESWEEKDNGDIVFHLRKDVTFHSGNKLTAADVVFSLRRAVKSGLVVTSYFTQWGYNKENVDEKFRALDDYTVIMEAVTKVTPKLKLLLLARQLGGILDSKLVMANEKDGDLGRQWLASHEAGSGPFTLVNWQVNDVITMAKYDNYWGEKAKLNRIILRHLPESQVQRLQLEKGDIDVGFKLVTADLDALSNNPNINVVKVPAAGFYYLCMNGRDPDLSDADLRRAIRYAIDYDGINSTVLKYYGAPVRALIPPGVGGYDPNIGNEYNVEKAKALLEKIGYKGGMKKILLTISTPPDSEIASVIQENLAKVGIEIDLRAGAGEQVFGPMRNRTFEMGVGTSGLTGPGDPDAWVRYNVYNPDNSDAAKLNNLQAWRQGIVVPGVDALLEEAGSILDENRRNELYRQTVKLYEDFGPTFIPIARRVDTFALSKRLKNYTINPTGTTRLNVVEKE